jgi:uncharacterized membrane protein HdeD (DUF308 family)
LATERVNSLARGVLGVAAGIAILIWPDISLAVMVVIVGVYAIADGLLSLGSASPVDPGVGSSSVKA